MDAMSFLCSGCGQPLDIDFKTRKGICAWCGTVNTFPRKVFNSSDKVEADIKSCLRCFSEQRYADARKHAEDVLTVAVDNVPALFVRAYYDAFLDENKVAWRMEEFFNQIRTIEMDAEEIEPTATLFRTTAVKLEAYEGRVLTWADHNLAGSELCNFAEMFFVPLLMKKTNINFFTRDLCDTLKSIAAKCSIPKVCYALLAAIKNNPDSPYPENRFFLKTKTQRFYDEFVVPLGGIIQAMESQGLRDKFYPVYQKQKEDLKIKMGGNN